MQRKTTLMRYLIIGISLVSIVFVGCSKTITDPVKTVSYSYTNDTDEDLTMEVYNKSGNLIKGYLIGIGLTIVTNTTKSEVPAVFHYDTHIDSIGNSISIKFTSGKCISWAGRDRIFTIKEYDNYSPELLRKKKYQLEFSITSSDLDQAINFK